VPQRVGRDVLVELGAIGAATDDVGEHVWLQPASLQAAEDVLLWRGLGFCSPPLELSH
jgi:hypothetical protein